MELTPEERERIYLEEKERLRVRENLQAQRKKGDNPWVMGCLWSFLALIGVIAVIAIIGSSGTTKPQDTIPLTEDQKMQRGCQVIYLQNYDKPIAQLSTADIDKIQLCRTLGYYHD